MKKTKSMSDFLASPVLLHYVVPLLMIYLIVGTISQKYIGLYEATKMYFSNAILWVGPVPLPGATSLIGLIFLNLMFKLIFKSPWKLKNAGNIITHIGAALLLVGGLITTLFSNEGYIDLAVGEGKTYVADYHVREFVLLDESGNEQYTFGHNKLSVGDYISIPNTPLKFQILEACRNCEIQKRRYIQKSHRGMSQHMKLVPTTLHMNDEENMAGLTFAVTGASNDGIYLVLENVPKFPEIVIDDKTYQFVLRRQRRDLPFRIELLDFKRELYPGTNMAKSYQSRVRILDGSTQWESLISMNEPLRYKGYTFFQASFIETPSGYVSVLATVWNAGRTFPYISGIVMCFGLIVHLFVRERKPIKNHSRYKTR